MRVHRPIFFFLDFIRDGDCYSLGRAVCLMLVFVFFWGVDADRYSALDWYSPYMLGTPRSLCRRVTAWHPIAELDISYSSVRFPAVL